MLCLLNKNNNKHLQKYRTDSRHNKNKITHESQTDFFGKGMRSGFSRNQADKNKTTLR